MKRNYISTALLVFTGLFFFGCVPQEPAAPPPPPAPQLYTHVIRYEGETLARIAHWYLGRSADWKVLLEYNPEIKPTRLRMGQTILIPQEKMKRLDAFPKPSAKKSVSTNTEPVSQSTVVNSEDAQPQSPEATATDDTSKDVVVEIPDEIQEVSAIQQVEPTIPEDEH